MVDLIGEMEARRQVLRLSQEMVALQVGVSQGQYSKVVMRKVPLTPKMAARMNRWLSADSAPTKGDALAILEKCMELMHLLQQYVEPHSGSGKRGK